MPSCDPWTPGDFITPGCDVHGPATGAGARVFQRACGGGAGLLAAAVRHVGVCKFIEERPAAAPRMGTEPLDLSLCASLVRHPRMELSGDLLDSAHALENEVAVRGHVGTDTQSNAVDDFVVRHPTEGVPKPIVEVRNSKPDLLLGIGVLNRARLGNDDGAR